jgi:capsular polysaccharide biosynthesis protein
MGNNKEISLEMIVRSWRTILVSTVVFSVVAFFISTIIAPQYGSETQILILQKSVDIDAYRATKSSEFAGEVLTRVVSSSDFMTGALAKAGENYLKYGATPEDQMKNWNKAINVSNFGSTGIIKIEVSDTSKKEDRKMTEAIISELLDNGVKYHGNENITLKKIGGPVYFSDPVFPIIWLNVLAAAIAGIFFSIGLVFVLGERVTSWFSKGSHESYDYANSGLVGGAFEYRRDSF